MTVAVEPIRTEADYQRALAELERLWGSEEGTPDGDTLDVLMDLVEAYERRHYPIAPPLPLDAIRFAMDQRGIDSAELGKLLGSSAKATALLSGRRRLSLEMVRKLHLALNIPLESLITYEPICAPAKPSAR